MSDHIGVGHRKLGVGPAKRVGLKSARIRHARLKYAPLKSFRPHAKFSRIWLNWTKPCKFSDDGRKPAASNSPPAVKIQEPPVFPSANSNVIDFESRRRAVVKWSATAAGGPAESTVIRCIIVRPGKTTWEHYDLVGVPATDDEITLGYDPRVYFIRSIRHLAVEAGGGKPGIFIRLRGKKRKSAGRHR